MTTRNFYLPVESKVFLQDILDRLTVGGTLQMPVAKVEIVDTDSTVYELTSCREFSISLKRETPMAEFNMVLEKASVWNIRTVAYLDLLKPDIRKRINIYFGQVISGSITYVQMFTGIPMSIPETYKYGDTDMLSISGRNLAQLLLRTAGTYSSTQYTGTSKDLIEYWCDQAGVTYNLIYTESINMTNQAIAYENALAGLLDMIEVLGPDIEAYFTAQGQLIMRDSPWWTDGANEYDYDEDSILEFQRFENTGKVHTQAIVTGATSGASHTRNASSSIIDIYGTNKITISSGLINTLAQAENLSYDLLKHGGRHMDMGEVKIQLNPYLNIGTLLTVKDASVSTTPIGPFKAASITHTFRANSIHESTMKGFLNESSSSSSASSISSSSSSLSLSSSSSSSRSSLSLTVSSSSSSISVSSSSSLSVSSSSSSLSLSISSSSSSSLSLSSSSSSSSLSLSISSSSSSLSVSSSSSLSLSSSSSSSSLSSSSRSSSSSSLSLLAGNDFSGDANCVALWRFESGALTTDTIGTNTLTNNNAVAENAVDYKEGAGSADFESGSTQYFDITDANLDAGFPLKSGDSVKNISVCGWFQMESMPADHNGLYSKWGTLDDTKSIRIFVAASGAFVVDIGYNSGADQESLYSAGSLVTGRFYHFGFTYQNSDKSWKLVVWDDTASSKIINTSGTATNNISSDTEAQAIGLGYFATLKRMPFDGEIDEVVVFKDILTTGEIDQIRQGTYS